MEYVAGPSLAAVIRAQGTLSPRCVLGLIAQDRIGNLPPAVSVIAPAR
jgi:hypothetical protein